MDYSVQTYLERLSTEKLCAFLQDCFSGDEWKNYEYAMPTIRDILVRRAEGEEIPLPAKIWKRLHEIA